MSTEPNRIPPRTGRPPTHDQRTFRRTNSDAQSPLEGLYNWLRLSLRLAWISVWTGLMFVVWSAGWIVVFYNNKWRMKWRHAVFGVWAKLFLKIIGGRLTVRGSVPEPPFFMVSNHLSYLDIPVLASVIDTTFVAKQEVENWAVIGTLTKIMETIYIDRDDCYDIPRVNEDIEHHLGFDDGVLVFPEATSTDGEYVRPFNSPLLDVPARTSRPVEYTHIQYSTPSGVVPAKHSICFWGDMEFGSHFLKLLTLPQFSVTVTMGSGSISGHCRKALARRLTSAVRNLHSTHSRNRWISSHRSERSTMKQPLRDGN